MPRSRALRIALTIVAGVAVAATAAGVTYAATSSTTKVVYACANRTGTLKLLSKGICPRGYSKVAINKQGPRGLTGPRGSQGVRGPRGLQGIQGDPGPGALTIRSATDSTSQTDVHDQLVPGTGLNVHAVCEAGDGSASGVYLDDKDASASYAVTGSYDLQAPGAHAVLVYTGHTNGPNLASGLGLVEYTQSASLNSSSEFVIQEDSSTGGQMTADVTVTRGGERFILHLYVAESPTHCVAQAEIIPAT